MAVTPAFEVTDINDWGHRHVQDSLGNWCTTTVSRTFYTNTPGKVKALEVELLWQQLAPPLTVAGTAISRR